MYDIYKVFSIIKFTKSASKEKNLQKVLVIRFSSVGDIVLTFPALRFLSQNQVEIHYLTKAQFAPLVEMSGLVHVVHTISDHASLKELLLKTESLKQISFSHVFDLHRNLRSWIVVKVLKAKASRIRKFRFKEFFLFIFRKKIFNWIFRPIDRAKEAVVTVGGAEVTTGILLDKTKETHIIDLPKNNFICICAESAWPQKQWSIKCFLELAQILSEKGYGIVWLGLKSLTTPPNSLNLIAKLTLPQTAQVLKKAKLLICNDSGLMHLSEAVGTPVVTIFGPTTVEIGFSPRLPQSRIVEAKLWCRPCSKSGRFCIRFVKPYKCLQDISVQNVLTYALEVLRNGSMQPYPYKSMDVL